MTSHAIPEYYNGWLRKISWMYKNVGIEWLFVSWVVKEVFARTQRVTCHFYGKKKQYLFTLRSLYLKSMKGNKIGPLKLHSNNFCPKFGRSPTQWKIIDFERKTLPDWYKFSWWFLALSRLSPFAFGLMTWQETKKTILINSRLSAMDFFFFFFPRKSWSPSEDLTQVPLPS